jgi:VanZ family protein
LEEADQLPKLSREFRLFLQVWLPVAVYISLVFYFSSRSQLPGGLTLGSFDKLAHFSEYFVLGLLLGRAARASLIGRPSASAWLLAVILGMAIGASDETLQRFVPGRDSSIYDFMADFAGVVLSQIVLDFFIRRRRRQEHPGRREVA